jgi:predicted dehydrogenase
MPEPLRVAIIGVGQIAQRAHLPGFVRAGVNIVALCSEPDPEFKPIAQKYRVDRCYYDWQQMLQDGGFEAVSICTPPGLHCQMALKCLQYGYHVLVEKPMATTLDQCDQMIEAAAQAERLLMISHNQRFMVHHQQVKQILDSGHLGRPCLVHAVFGHAGPEVWSPNQQWYFQADLAGPGVIADLGSHKLDLLCWLLNQKIVDIGAMGATFEKPTSAPDTATCFLRFSQGTLGTLHVSWVFRPDWENSLVVRCERGVIRVPTDVAKPVRVLALDATGNGEETTYAGDASDDPAGWFETIASFVRTISENEPSPVSGEQGKAAVEAILAANEAIAQKTIIHLSD